MPFKFNYLIIMKNIHNFCSNFNQFTPLPGTKFVPDSSLIRQSFGSSSGALRLPPKASRSPVEAVTKLSGSCQEADSNPSRRLVEGQSNNSRSGLEGIEHFPEQKEEKMRFKVD